MDTATKLFGSPPRYINVPSRHCVSQLTNLSICPKKFVKRRYSFIFGSKQGLGMCLERDDNCDALMTHCVLS